MRIYRLDTGDRIPYIKNVGYMMQEAEDRIQDILKMYDT